jgi:exo-beta-1,3-glucanase (GH17 family)/cellulose synthase/poly-beta-1,6-N-acetylglucosamine synthase-like glycosyltransferase
LGLFKEYTMTLSSALRNSGRALTASLIALAVAALNLALSTHLNRPVDMIDWDGSISGFAYSGFQRDQDPLRGAYPTDAQIQSDLKLLAGHTDRIRSYTSAENENLPRFADDAGLRVATGVWLSTDRENNEREMKALTRAVLGSRNIDAAIVGNETLLRGDLTVNDLTDYLKGARARLKKLRIPVTTAEPWHIWLKHPELARHVDFITVHLLPYWEGVPVEAAVDHVFLRYEELQRAFPKKRIVIGEVGWPSNGDRIKLAVASKENAARFMREFLDRARNRPVEYYLMEAFDQPWKIGPEGRAGGYWGMFDAFRQAKYPLQGAVVADAHWQTKALVASALALLPMLAFAAAFRRVRLDGRLFYCALIQAVISLSVWLAGVPAGFYLSAVDSVTFGLLVPALVGMILILLVSGFEFTEVLWKRRWQRWFAPQATARSGLQPFVSIHLPCCNEPPEMVCLTLDSLAKLDYQNFEVLVIDNNTKDEALWRPVQAHVARLGSRFRFFHLDNWPGFKAGALNFALGEADPHAKIVGVVDADYAVHRDWLKALVGHFENPQVAVVQAPQAHRDYQHSFFQRMCNWEFDGFFRIGMHHRNERNAIIQHGTMTLVRRAALVFSGKWSEWCICEDAELGLRLMHAGYETRYVDTVFGRGLTPADFKAFKAQRLRWAFGAMQILRRHLGWLIKPGPLSLGQRFHFLTGWFSWFGDAVHLPFTLLAIGWTAGMILDPARFTLPVTVFLVPLLGFLIAKASFGPLLYALRVRCDWRDNLGAALASLALSHAIARGIWQGLWAKKGVFVRTAKGTRRRSLLALFDAVREEALLLAALVLAMFAVDRHFGSDHQEAKLWAAVLAAQALPYAAALVTSLISAHSAARAVKAPRTASAPANGAGAPHKGAATRPASA